MTDHVDTIRPYTQEQNADLSATERRWLDRMPSWSNVTGGAIERKFDRAVAERQQAIDALREIADLTIARGDTWTTDPASFARAALLSLGEQVSAKP